MIYTDAQLECRNLRDIKMSPNISSRLIPLWLPVPE